MLISSFNSLLPSFEKKKNNFYLFISTSRSFKSKTKRVEKTDDVAKRQHVCKNQYSSLFVVHRRQAKTLRTPQVKEYFKIIPNVRRTFFNGPLRKGARVPYKTQMDNFPPFGVALFRLRSLKFSQVVSLPHFHFVLFAFRLLSTPYPLYIQSAPPPLPSTPPADWSAISFCLGRCRSLGCGGLCVAPMWCSLASPLPLPPSPKLLPPPKILPLPMPPPILLKEGSVLGKQA